MNAKTRGEREADLARELRKVNRTLARVVDYEDTYYILSEPSLAGGEMRMYSLDVYTLEKAEAWAAAELERWIAGELEQEAREARGEVSDDEEQ